MDLQPCYKFSKPNKRVFLSDTKLSASVENKIHETDAKVYIELLPRPNIRFRASFPSPQIKKPTVNGNDVSGMVKRKEIFLNGKSIVEWHPKIPSIIGRGDENTKIVKVVFHLFNYVDFSGTRRSSEHFNNSSQLIKHIDLNANDWEVELKSLITTPSTFETLNKIGGYGLTHIGRLQKEDGTAFDGKKAKEMLHALHLFLSFSSGMDCHPCLAVGFDGDNNRVWEVWDEPRERWKNRIMWFDGNKSEQLVNLFPGFMSKWNDPDWREALEDGINFI